MKTPKRHHGGWVPHHCTSCGQEVQRQRGNYCFKESGLSNVLLKDIEVYKCRYCGTEDPIIPRLNELMQLIAIALTEKPSLLVGAEIRFLRKYLGMNQETFASLLGSDKTVLCKWERDQQTVGVKTDRLIRAVVLGLGAGLRPFVEQSVRKFTQINREIRTVRVELNPEELTYAYA
jgi:putative zinc finger/helix-turn-helix YgiT family protein